MLLLTDVKERRDVELIPEKLVAALAAPWRLSGRVMRLTASIGISSCRMMGRSLRFSFVVPMSLCIGRSAWAAEATRFSRYLCLHVLHRLIVDSVGWALRAGKQSPALLPVSSVA